MDFEYRLVDCGNERRLEMFGGVAVDRPCPQAYWKKKFLWKKPDAFFVRQGKRRVWEMSEKHEQEWGMKIGKVHAQLKLSSNGQIGIFPEQFENWMWIDALVRQHSDRPLRILNLFAYTGMASLFSSDSHTEVVHVDGAKSAINWAKRNAQASGMEGNTIRWICDDVQKFLAREIKRGNRYDAVILDPPAFGRGGGQEWKIERDLPKTMAMIEQILVEKPLFVLLTCHAPEHFSVEDLAQMLERLSGFEKKAAERLFLTLKSEDGNDLPSSFGARIS